MRDKPRHQPTRRVSQLQLFAQAFPSEAHLRSAIADLLRKMRGIEVRETHGPNEKGKDLLFYGPDGLRDRALFACVVKNEPITGSASAATGARSVFHQAEQSLDTPALNETGESESVRGVYIMSPFEFSPAAQESIQGALKKLQGQVRFMCGGALLDAFLTNWPEFFLESDMLTGYLTSLRDLDTHGGVMDLISNRSLNRDLIAEAMKPLTRVYIAPGLTQELMFFQRRNMQIPSAAELGGRISKSTVDLIEANVRSARSSFSKIIDELPNVPEGGLSLDGDLSNWLSALRLAWTGAFQFEVKRLKDVEQQRKKRSDGGKAGTEELFGALAEGDARVRIEGVSILQAQWEKLCTGFQMVLDEVDLTLNLANEFVRTLADSVEDPRLNPDFVVYRSAERLASVDPDIISAERSGRSFPFKSGINDPNLGSLVITAPAGYGKTSFCRWHTLRDAQLYESGVTNVIPIYVPLYQMKAERLTSFENAFLASGDLRRFIARREQAKHTVRIYLDGIDEVASPEVQERITKLARTGPQSADVIITARDHVAGPWLSTFPRLSIDRFGPKQVQEVVTNWLDSDVDAIADINQQLDGATGLRDLMGIPLLATLIVGVFRNLHSLPRTRIKLYELFVDLHCGGWDLVRNVRRDTKYGVFDKQIVLTTFASVLHYSDKRNGSENDFKAAVRASLPTLAKNWHTLLSEVVQDGLVQNLGDNFLFSHFSFQEFLTAKFLSNGETRRAELAVRSFFKGNDWWREVMGFYVEFTLRPHDMLAWLRRQKEKAASKTTGAITGDLEARHQFLVEKLLVLFPGLTA